MSNIKAKTVGIRSPEELIRFMENFSNGGGIGVEKVDGKYFTHTLDEVVELKPVFSDDYTISDFKRQIEYNPQNSQRRSAQI